MPPGDDVLLGPQHDMTVLFALRHEERPERAAVPLLALTLWVEVLDAGGIEIFDDQG